MRVIQCPRCRRVTEEMEAVGSCEHCGADAVTAGDPIETEGPDPVQQAEASARWRWFTAIFWFATVLFETACFALLLLWAYDFRAWATFNLDLNYLVIAAALTAIGL